MADDSIWKKEVSFKRKPEEQADDATPAADGRGADVALEEGAVAGGEERAAEAEAVVDETPVTSLSTTSPSPRNMFQGQSLARVPTSLSGRRK